MISVTKKLKITGATLPAEVEFIDLSASSCVILPATKTVTTTSFSAIFKFEDEFCLTSANIAIKVKDAEGCESTINVPITNPCGNFELSQIGYNGNLSFSVAATGAKAPLTYDWEWDTLLFTRDNTTPQSVLKLNPIGTIQGVPYTFIKVTVTDAWGCVRETEVQFQLCVPSAKNTSVNLYCGPTGATSLNNGFTIPASSCTEYPLDWSTFEFLNTPNGVTWQVTSPGVIQLQADVTDVAPGTYQWAYVIQNTLGITSNIAYMQVHVPDCVTVPGVGIPPNIQILPDVRILPCPPQVGYLVDVDLSALVNSFTNVDWNTLAFVPLPGQSLVTPIQLQSVSGIANLTLGSHMTYEVNSINTGNDIIQWSVCNISGACAIGTITFVYQCFVPPIANADAICATCCESTPYIDLTANDIGPLDPESLVIVQQPLHGSVTVDLTGNVAYTADCNYNGPDMFTYMVYNLTSGNASNEAVVSVNVICAGANTTLNLCS